MYHPKPVMVYKDGKEVGEFRTQYEAVETLNINKDYFRKMVRDGITYKGYTAKLKHPEDKHRKPHNRVFNNDKKEVHSYDKEGNYVASFNSIGEASREINISKSSIRRALNEKTATAKGYYWRMVKKDVIFVRSYRVVNPNIVRKVKGKSVTAISKEGEDVKKFDSIREAAQWAGVTRSAVSLVLTGRQSTAGGYKWKYDEV